MSHHPVDIYTKFGCGFCVRAKRLLDEKGVDYTEHDITMGGPKHVGGSDELAALEREGKLDALLAG